MLDQLRLGKTNAEIAVVLGISPDAVKYHVSNMLSKLGLGDRHELASWVPGREPARRWWATGGVVGAVRRLGGGVRVLGGAAGRRAGMVGGAAAAALVAAAALFIVLRALPSSDEPPPLPTATATATASPAPAVSSPATPVATVVPTTPAPATSAPAAPTATGTPTIDEWSEFRARPVVVPEVKGGDPCPVTPGRSHSAWQPSSDLGAGPVYLSGRSGVLTLHRVDGPDYVSIGRSADYRGAVLVRGLAVRGRSSIRFARHQYTYDRVAASGNEVRMPAGRVDSLEGPTTGSSVAWIDPQPGCYVVQADGDGFSESIVFEIRDSGGSETVGTNLAGDPGARIVLALSDGSAVVAGPDAAVPQVDLGKGEHPSWSPDGRYLALGGGLVIDSADGSLVRELGPAGGMEHGWERGVWGPDGTIAWVRLGLVGEIITDRPDGTGVSLSVPPGQPYGRPLDGSPAWSPDGKKVAFVSERDGNDEVYIVNADGTGATRLTNHRSFDGLPSWSPDGTQILWEATRNYRRGIWVMNADGSDQRQLAPGNGTSFYPAWSPDGERIAFSSNRDGSWDIYVINADGTGLARLTSDVASDWAPVWSADGQQIGFLSNRSGNPEFCVMSPDGSDLSVVTTTTGGWVDGFAWAP